MRGDDVEHRERCEGLRLRRDSDWSPDKRRRRDRGRRCRPAVGRWRRNVAYVWYPGREERRQSSLAERHPPYAVRDHRRAWTTTAGGLCTCSSLYRPYLCTKWFSKLYVGCLLENSLKPATHDAYFPAGLLAGLESSHRIVCDAGPVTTIANTVARF